MQNMHKTTYDRHLTGVHRPIHRGWCRGSGTKGDLSTRAGSAHRGVDNIPPCYTYIDISVMTNQIICIR